MSADAKSITVLQLSDLHLFAESDQNLLGLNTNLTFDLILEAVQALPSPPDVILLTGDLAQDESAATYQVLQKKFSDFSMPIYAIPGNHDNPDLIQSILCHPPFQSERMFELGGWQFILLNSAVSHQVYGKLSQKTLTGLKHTLSKSDKPTLIALHHPAYAVQSAWLDEIGLLNREEFWAVLDDYPQVKAVLCGHIHQDMPFSRRGIQYLSTPSTCVQFKPLSHAFSSEPIDPGFRLLTLWPDATFHSWIQRVPVKQTVNPLAMGY